MPFLTYFLRICILKYKLTTLISHANPKPMDNIHIIDAIFLARRDIRSLPDWHAARWSGWLRFACARIGVPLNAILLGLLPLRNGKRFIRQGDSLILRLILKTSGLSHLASLGRMIRNMESLGEFSTSSLELLFWRDALAHHNHPPDCQTMDAEPLSLDLLSREITRLVALENFSLDFFVPMRLKAPHPEDRNQRRETTFCAPDFFASRDALAYLCARIRARDMLPPCQQSSMRIRLVSHALSWQDIRYNETRKIALGGLTGIVTLSAPLDEDMAVS